MIYKSYLIYKQKIKEGHKLKQFKCNSANVAIVNVIFIALHNSIIDFLDDHNDGSDIACCGVSFRCQL